MSAAAGTPSGDALLNRCSALELENANLKRINEVLMNRVERATDEQGNSFSLFQAAIALESKVKERTAALKDALHRLERSNRELTASNELAQQASRAKSAFLAAMSHELRTPMNGVVGMTELLLNSALEDRQRESALVIQRSALSLLRILNDILDFSKIEAGQLVTEHTAFDLRQELEHALHPLRVQANQKALALVLDWGANVPIDVVGDPVRIMQIVTNLVGNGIKFTTHGTITVRVRASEGDVIRFEVEDTGIGIATAALPRLFESFSQADSSTTRRFGGTGLGLAIVRRLCEVMQGQCGVHSEEGRGSCFWFELPLERNRAAGAAPIPALASAPSLQSPADYRRHVLVAEDNAINQIVARGYLESLGYECTIVENGLQAVAALTKEHAFDVVMMDWQMPELDGLEATQRVRAYEAPLGRHTPIVALTANALVGDRERCVQAGMDDFLSKPFQLPELAAVLDRWCVAQRTLAPASASVLAS